MPYLRVKRRYAAMAKRLAATITAATARPTTIADSAETDDVFGKAVALAVVVGVGLTVVVVVGVGVGEVDAVVQLAPICTDWLLELVAEPLIADPDVTLPITLAAPVTAVCELASRT